MIQSMKQKVDISQRHSVTGSYCVNYNLVIAEPKKYFDIPTSLAWLPFQNKITSLNRWIVTVLGMVQREQDIMLELLMRRMCVK